MSRLVLHSSTICSPFHQFNGRRGHFIDDDVAAFDAPFFSVTSKEAKAMDPMQRWTLEASYRAFEKGEKETLLHHLGQDEMRF